MPEPSSCPLCGEPNGCAMANAAASQWPCWCTHAAFSADLLASVPAAALGKACICARCVGKPHRIEATTASDPQFSKS